MRARRPGRPAGDPAGGSDGNTADDKAFCAFLTEEQPKLREVGSGVGAQAALTIDLAAWVSEHPGQQRRTAAEYDAAAQRGCPEVRASIIATTGHDRLAGSAPVTAGSDAGSGGVPVGVVRRAGGGGGREAGEQPSAGTTRGDTLMTSMSTQADAHDSGTFALGGDLPVHRLGYGTMQLTGEGVWGDPPDHDEAVRVLRRAVALGVTFIDTADAYGPFTAELLLREALHPYPPDLVIATKAGFVRPGPGEWVAVGRPAYLRQQVELSLRHLGVERIDLLQLHRVDPEVPIADQVGELAAMQQEGKIRHIGLSEVTTAQIEEASRTATIVSVQNRYNLADRASEDVLAHAERHGMGFIPWFPLATGELAREGGPLDRIAEAHGAQPSQLALAWLLRRSPVMLPIPGTSKVAHLEHNIAAAGIRLTDEHYEELTNAV